MQKEIEIPKNCGRCKMFYYDSKEKEKYINAKCLLVNEHIDDIKEGQLWSNCKFKGAEKIIVEFN